MTTKLTQVQHLMLTKLVEKKHGMFLRGAQITATRALEARGWAKMEDNGSMTLNRKTDGERWFAAITEAGREVLSSYNYFASNSFNMKGVLRAALVAKCEYECPATQDAIDRMTKEFAHSRSRMFEVLDPAYGLYTDSNLHETFMVGWLDDKTVLLATGRTRDSWMDLLNEQSKRRILNEQSKR